jgi:hypothetical protein
MRKVLAMVMLGCTLLAGAAFASCGHCEKKAEAQGHACAMGKHGDSAEVLRQAAEALKSANAELAQKVQAIADDCCKYHLHE